MRELIMGDTYKDLTGAVNIAKKVFELRISQLESVKLKDHLWFDEKAAAEHFKLGKNLYK